MSSLKRLYERLVKMFPIETVPLLYLQYKGGDFFYLALKDYSHVFTSPPSAVSGAFFIKSAGASGPFAASDGSLHALGRMSDDTALAAAKVEMASVMLYAIRCP